MKKATPFLVVVALLAAFAIPVVGMSFAHAAVSTTPPQVYACLQSDGKTIDPATIQLNTAPTCVAPDVATPTSWNVQGIQGVPGISGYQTVSTKFTVYPGQVRTVECPKGDNVLSGGVELGTLNRNFGISLSHPDGNNDGWQGAYSSDNGQKTSMKVWAVCATVTAVISVP